MLTIFCVLIVHLHYCLVWCVMGRTRARSPVVCYCLRIICTHYAFLSNEIRADCSPSRHMQTARYWRTLHSYSRWAFQMLHQHLRMQQLTTGFTKTETAVGTSRLLPNMHFKTSVKDKRQTVPKKGSSAHCISKTVPITYQCSNFLGISLTNNVNKRWILCSNTK